MTELRSLRLLSIPLMLLTLLSATTGCSSVTRPGVAIEGASFGASSDDAQVLDFALRLENENREPLELHEFHYTLMINGQTVYSGRRSAEATLSARGGKVIVIPAVVPRSSLSDAGSSIGYQLSGRLWYRSPGELADILFDSGLHRPSVGFGTQGDLELSGRSAARSPENDR